MEDGEGRYINLRRIDQRCRFLSLTQLRSSFFITLDNCSGPLFSRKVWADSAWPISISIASDKLDWLKRTRSSKLSAVLRSRWAASFIGINSDFSSLDKKMALSHKVLAAYNQVIRYLSSREKTQSEAICQVGQGRSATHIRIERLDLKSRIVQNGCHFLEVDRSDVLLQLFPDDNQR